jgi:hypothetical protein
VTYQARELPVKGKSESTPPVAEIEELETEESLKAKQADHFWIIRIASVVTVFTAWEVLGRQVNPIFMSYPTAIAVAAWQMFRCLCQSSF